MGRRVCRRYKCQGCGRKRRSCVPNPWCHECKRHMVQRNLCIGVPPDPEREARILAHRDRVEREMPREGTTDPLDCFSRRAL